MTGDIAAGIATKELQDTGDLSRRSPAPQRYLRQESIRSGLPDIRCHRRLDNPRGNGINEDIGCKAASQCARQPDDSTFGSRIGKMIARAPPERDRTGEYQPPRRRLAKQRREYARQVEDGRQVGCDGGVPYVLEFLGGVVVDVDAGQMNDRI